MTEQSLPNTDYLTKECPLLDATFRETLRLATAPSSMRLVDENTEIGGYTFYKGDRVLLPSMHLHRAKHVWGEDADSFRPERILEVGDKIDIVGSGYLVRSHKVNSGTRCSLISEASVRRRVVVLSREDLLTRGDHGVCRSGASALRLGAHGASACPQYRSTNARGAGPAYALRPQDEANAPVLKRCLRTSCVVFDALWSLLGPSVV